MRFRKQSGVALIITLIMLSVITVIAVAFLALSRRERASVVHSANAIDAQFMADSAVERAKAEILANIIATSNLLGPDFFVSGSRRTAPPLLYDPPEYYYEDWKGKTDGKDIGAISRLSQNGRPPVFVGTNREPRFYVDLNRNGRYDTNGLLEVLDANGVPIVDASNNVQHAVFTGDPEFRGVLPRPQFVHSKDNRFNGRYAFVVQPIGRSLDINFIHNDAGRTIGQATAADGFRRNQGVGSWEINLAAFLADLNASPSGYDPRPPDNAYFYNLGTNSGLAFVDAKQLLSFRYSENWQTLSSVGRMLPMTAFDLTLASNKVTFTNDGIDAFVRAPISAFGAPLTQEADPWNEQWPGSDSRKHLFSVHDFFRRGTPNADLSGFTNRLGTASAGQSSYDRYTYYRMLAQLGTDSAPESTNKININYKSPGFGATNFFAWSPTDFFTTAALRLLREEFKTNTDVYASVRQFRIPVAIQGITNSSGELYPLYSSRIHRLLQVAANIYEATVGQKGSETEPFYPTVFRPEFEQVNGNLYITGYTDETARGLLASRVLAGAIPIRDMNETNGVPIAPSDFVYGVPLIIGARKGFPNFNEFAVQNIAQFTRKIEVRKDPGGALKETNQMFIVGISNVFAMEAWNSYQQDYPRPLNILFQNVVSVALTNNAGVFRTNSFTTVYGLTTPAITFAADQYRTAGISNNTVIADSVYRSGPPPTFDPISTTNIFDRNGASYTNQWGMQVRNKVVYFLVDDGHIVDSFSAADFNADFDISKELNNPRGDDENYPLWNNKPDGNITTGVRNQIKVSKGEVPAMDWNSYSQNPASGDDKEKSINGFLMFLGLSPRPGTPVSSQPYTNLVMQAPFTPTRKMIHTSKWEVNDPLVHYLSDDLRKYENGILTNDVVINTVTPADQLSITNDTSIGRMNDRYRPWGGNPNQEQKNDPTAFDLRVKDPGVAQSDSWDFPTNKFPNIGWLGRVHRGTPWQTIYLKAYPTSDQEPDRWLMPDGGPGLARETHPTNDWKLLDVFTAALHPNATRGRLSINQTNLAAWSAILSGVGVTTLEDRTPNSDPIVRVNKFIQPGSIEPHLMYIFEGISRERDRMPFQRFEQLGDILRVPELTTLSPYVTMPFITERADPDKKYQLKDLDYERIPDQILSLLQVGEPRFVIYAFGQSLKPEYIDPTTGVALNYQITGEVSTRTVVRVDYDPISLNPTDINYLKPNVNRPHIVVESFNILPPE